MDGTPQCRLVINLCMLSQSVDVTESDLSSTKLSRTLYECDGHKACCGNNAVDVFSVLFGQRVMCVWQLFDTSTVDSLKLRLPVGDNSHYICFASQLECLFT